MDPNTQTQPLKRNLILLKNNAKLLIIELLGLSLIITGIILLSRHTRTVGSEYVEDYTDCIKYNDVKTCKEALKTKQGSCSCYININLTQPIDAPVTAYYELTSYDQNNSSYYYSRSSSNNVMLDRKDYKLYGDLCPKNKIGYKYIAMTNNCINTVGELNEDRDDKQLSGELSMTPSPRCDPYSYVDTAEGRKPIAPCGAVADTMFNDTFLLRYNNYTHYVPYILTGLISESSKASFHNPPGNLEEAFKNYSKPQNWPREVWELDPTNPANNGFQNEAFTAWMKTELKRKPVWRVNHTDPYEHGIAAGDYTLRVEYAYPPSRYDGQRKFIISSLRVVIDHTILGFGICLLILGFLLVLVKIAYNKKKYKKYLPCKNADIEETNE